MLQKSQFRGIHMNKNKVLLNSVGVMGFLEWLKVIKDIGYNYNYENGLYTFNEEVSRSFFIGKQKIKGKNEVFIGTDTFFSSWAKLIEWENISINTEKKEIGFLTKEVSALNSNLTGFESFALIFPIDVENKMISILNYNNINLREYYIDSDGSVRINRHKIIANLKIEQVNNIQVKKLGLIQKKEDNIRNEILKETSLGTDFQNNKI